MCNIHLLNFGNFGESWIPELGIRKGSEGGLGYPWLYAMAMAMSHQITKRKTLGQVLIRSEYRGAASSCRGMLSVLLSNWDRLDTSPLVHLHQSTNFALLSLCWTQIPNQFQFNLVSLSPFPVVNSHEQFWMFIWSIGKSSQGVPKAGTSWHRWYLKSIKKYQMVPELATR